ncbi:MAG: hypothetical protein U0Q14_03920 [Dermatophilaceae bacterium]
MSIQLIHHPLATRRLRRAESPAAQVGRRSGSAAPRRRGRVAAFADGLLSSIAAAATGHLTGI